MKAKDLLAMAEIERHMEEIARKTLAGMCEQMGMDGSMDLTTEQLADELHERDMVVDFTTIDENKGTVFILDVETELLMAFALIELHLEDDGIRTTVSLMSDEGIEKMNNDFKEFMKNADV